MKITKFGHACLLIEKDGTNLIIDPGSLTELPDNLPSIDAVIVSEEHYDHLSVDNLRKLASAGDSLNVYTTKSVAQSIAEHDFSLHAITTETTVEIGVLQATLKPVNHAVVYQKSPCTSLTITIGNELYYPSDSFTTTDQTFKVLALPTSGPWFKLSDAIELANAVQSEIIIPTHNALNSEIGNDVTHKFISANLANLREFKYIRIGDSIEI